MKAIAIIPALNEEEGIAEVINGFRKSGIKEVIVADGGSRDKTAGTARKNDARVISVPRGKGNGFRSALKKISLSNNMAYVMIDGDASYDSREVDKLLEKLDKFDVVTGKRKLLIHDAKSLVHVVGNVLISLLASLLFLHWNPDLCTGYWAFKGSALKKLKEKIDAEKFELEADLFANLCKLGLNHATVSISYSKRKGDSKLVSTDALKILFKIIKARFSK